MTTSSHNGTASRAYTPTGQAKSAINMGSDLSAVMAVGSILGLFAAWGFELHPLRAGWGYLFFAACAVGALGAIKRSTYRSEDDAYRSSSVSFIAALISVAIIFAGWILLILTDLHAG